MSIIVKDESGFQVLAVQDEGLLSDVQEVYSSPPFSVEVGPGATAGSLASGTRDHHIIFLKHIMRKRGAGLMQAIDQAPDQARVKTSVRGMFKMMMDIIEILE